MLPRQDQRTAYEKRYRKNAIPFLCALSEKSITEVLLGLRDSFFDDVEPLVCCIVVENHRRRQTENVTRRNPCKTLRERLLIDHLSCIRERLLGLSVLDDLKSEETALSARIADDRVTLLHLVHSAEEQLTEVCAALAESFLFDYFDGSKSGCASHRVSAVGGGSRDVLDCGSKLLGYAHWR